MHTGNPFTNAPPLPRPKGHLHSRSISRSPARQHARDYDPLLRDLSPTATLRAFVTDPNDMNGNYNSDALARSIQTSSLSERALGAKAAQACLDLRAWTRELEAWEWPGTFDCPEPARKKMRLSAVAAVEPSNEQQDEEEEYYGSLPARIVQAYEKRADEIGHGLDQIEVEELKDYVLNSHYRIDSRPQSRNDSFGANSTTTYMKRLDDFTALVTATILQALPYLSKLNRLLDTWTMRLIILRSAPKFLRELNKARTDLDHGWAAIAASSASNMGTEHTKFDRQTMQEMKNMVEHQVTNLGRKLDRFLDRLEGQDDSVPEAWIDDFEHLESAYGTWVVQAERKVMENEWRDSIERSELDATPLNERRSRLGVSATITDISELEDPSLDHDAVRRLSMDLIGNSTRPDNAAASSNKSKGRSSNIAGESADKVTDRSNAQQIPILIASEAEDEDPQQRGLERVPSSGSVSKEDGMGQVARRRAQFLNDIDRNQSLKTSKSPVRPFEHASNAFTRLFKKDRSPEQAKAKRSTSNNLGSADERSDSAERKPLSPLSIASSTLNTASMESSVRSAASSSKSSRVGTPEIEAVNNKNVAPKVDAQGHNPTRREQSPFGDLSNVEETTTPETYKPSGLLPAFQSGPDQFPTDWPLVSPADTPQEERPPIKTMYYPSATSHEMYSGPEVNTPDEAIQTDAFDRMFVETLPKASKERPGSARAPERSAPWTNSHRRPASLPRNVRKQKPELPNPGGYLDMKSARKPRSVSSSTHSKSRSLSSNPPVPQSSSSKGSGDTTWRDSQDENSPNLGLGHESAGPFTLQTPDSEPRSEERKRPNFAKRASTTSIEAFPRSQLKTIDVPRVPRRSSVSPAATPPQTPPRSRRPSTAAQHGNVDPADPGPMNYKGMVAFPTPPPRSSTSSRATPPPFSAGRDTPTVLRRSVESSPKADGPLESPARDDEDSPAAPLNAAMNKRRGKSALRIENSPMSDPMSSAPKKNLSRTPDEDTFDRHISEVLETLPGQIRFTSRPGAETPNLRVGDSRGYNGPRPKATARRASKSGGGITIAPAEQSPRKTTSASDPVVKLYHLTTSGRDEPIKLFVRLVGEGERVMVRVGGGWADLADYLRQYAEHHGSRTVSEGNIEVQTVTSAPLIRKVSGPAEINRARSPIPSANGTPRPSSKDSDSEWPMPLQSNGRSTPSTTGRQTPTLGTPKSSSTGSSRPSTSNASRPPSRQNTGEVGLAGPSSGKKGTLPEQKAKWVEGMIERAKQASAEKSKEDKQKYFGELGKAGGTRRVIFRSSSGVGSGDKSN